jgi:DNA replication protein DnaC
MSKCYGYNQDGLVDASTCMMSAYNGDGLCPPCRKKFVEIWINKFSDKQKSMDFSTFKDNPKLIKQASAYLDSLTKGSNKSMILWSSRCGTGKTHIATAIGKEYINYCADSVVRCVPVRMVTESELISRIRATYDNQSRESESSIIDEVTKANLVIIDDVGKVTFQSRDFIQRVYFLIIDRRYNQNKPVILTSNLGMAKLSGHIGEACVSRLYEMTDGNIIEFVGKDFREANFKAAQ